MKRAICFVLALCLALGGAGCGYTADVPPTPPGAQSGLSALPDDAEDCPVEEKLEGQSPSGTRALVAEPLESAVPARQPGEFMALESYGTGLEVEKENRSDGRLVRSYKGDEACLAALEDYVALLCSEYDFELAAEPYRKELESTFFDFCLRYTGPDGPLDGAVEGTFSQTPCDLMLYGTLQRGRLKGAIWYDPALSGVDHGYRRGQEEAGAAAPSGASALAGLWREADGGFSTTDGRLSAGVGQAALLWDGEAASAAARCLRYTDEQRLEVQIQSGQGADLVRFYLPLAQTPESGDILTAATFMVESGYAVRADGIFDELPRYTWPSMFAVLHEGSWIVPVLGMGGAMEQLTVRVMYADEATAVFYACARFGSAPHDLELLAAVDLTAATVEAAPTPGTGGGQGNCSACGGTGDCTTCGGTGRVRNLLAGTREWVDQTCTACRPAGSGNCPFCGGDGRA